MSGVEGELDRIRYELIDEDDEKIASDFYSFKLPGEEQCRVE